MSVKSVKSENHVPGVLRSPSTLHNVSFAGILANDPSQTARLLEACETHGCFYLTFGDAESDVKLNPVLAMAEQVFRMADDFFHLPVEEKMKWEMDKWGVLQIGGYKAAGKHTGVVQGKRDGFENFLVPLNAVAGLDSNHPNWPPVIRSHLPLLEAFELACHDIARTLVASLSSTMGSGIRIQDYHREQELSTTSLALLKYLPTGALTRDQVGHMAHTDVGSLTLLFTSSPGLQVFADSCWIPVTPQPGSIVINVGDALNFISENRFKSCLHRVVPPVGPSGLSGTRFALGFFLRPELSARFVDGDGREWTGEDWHRTKYRIFRVGNDEQKKTSLLTGRAGFLGQWENESLRIMTEG